MSSGWARARKGTGEGSEEAYVKSKTMDVQRPACRRRACTTARARSFSRNFLASDTSSAVVKTWTENKSVFEAEIELKR